MSAAGQIPTTDRPTRDRGNINPLKNATAALNGRTEERRTDRSAWKPVIKCELLLSLSLSLSPSLIRRLCTKVVVTCRRLPLSVQNEIPLLVLFPRSEGHCHCRCRARPPRGWVSVSLITPRSTSSSPLPSAAVIQLGDCLLKSAQTCPNKYLGVLFGQSSDPRFISNGQFLDSF